MVGALVFGSSGPGSSPGRGHCVVFSGKTRDSHSTRIHPGVKNGTGEHNARVSPAMNRIRSGLMSTWLVCRLLTTSLSAKTCFIVQ